MKLIENYEHGNIPDEKLIQYKLKQEEAFSLLLFRFSLAGDIIVLK